METENVEKVVSRGKNTYLFFKYENTSLALVNLELEGADAISNTWTCNYV